jgi:predicted RNA-binding Zn ribbon-like protein
VDWLDSGDGLVAWLAQAKLVPPPELKALAKRTNPDELDKVADQARTLREWFREFVRKHMGQPLTSMASRELTRLNTLLERDEMFCRVAVCHEATGSRLKMQMTRRWRSAESLLLPIGEAMARCVSDENFANVRACEGHNCTLIFADHTRRQDRRWCSMSVCGNRAKQTAHRLRLKPKR